MPALFFGTRFSDGVEMASANAMGARQVYIDDRYTLHLCRLQVVVFPDHKARLFSTELHAGGKMRADHALSHLADGEVCKAATAHGERDVRWSKSEWRFYYADLSEPSVCDFDEIEEWWISAIKEHPKGKLT